LANTRIGISLFVVVSILPPAQAAAQSDPFNIPPGPRRVDLSGSGGFLLSTDWSDLVLLGAVSPVSGALEQVLVRDIVVDPGPVFDAVVTYWEGRYGFRVHGGFAHSCIAVGRTCDAATGVAGTSSGVDVDTWIYDFGGAIGLVDYQRRAWVWPYVFFGVGGVTYNLERTVSPPLTFIERRPTSSASQVIISRDEPNELLIAIGELGIETKLALNVGVGTDVRIPLGPASLGLRLEASDHIHRSPIDVRILELTGFTGSQGETRFGFGPVHNLRVAAGLVVQFGR
jgi:hypothetical protein